MAVSEFLKGVEDCYACKDANKISSVRWCADHDPNLSEREKRLLSMFVGRVLERQSARPDESLGATLHRMSYRMRQLYKG